MNKRIMVIWGMLVFIILATILIIGINKKDKVLFRLERELNSSTKKYIKDNNIKVNMNESYTVQISDLIDKEYIKEDERIDKYCVQKIIVHKGLVFYEYKIYKDCEEKNISPLGNGIGDDLNE